MPTSEPLLGQLPARRRIRLRTILAFTTFVLIVAALAVGAVGGLYWAHFVGVDPATGRVAVFQGVPFEINNSHRLYRLVSRSSVVAASLPQQRARAAVRPQAALVERRRARPATAPGDRALMLARLATARNRELVNLRFLAVLTVAGFTAVLVARSGEVSSTSLVVRRTLPGALPRRAHRAAHATAAGRSVPAPARRDPRLGRSLRDLPDPARARARPGALDRDRRRGLRRGARAAARLPRARALPLPVRRARARAARVHDPVVLRDRHRDQRRAGVDPRRRPVLPAGRAREDLARAVPRRLPARAPRAARADADAGARDRAAAAATARAAARRCSARRCCCSSR